VTEEELGHMVVLVLAAWSRSIVRRVPYWPFALVQLQHQSSSSLSLISAGSTRPLFCRA